MILVIKKWKIYLTISNNIYDALTSRYTIVSKLDTMESLYNVLPRGVEKVRCNDSTLYPYREFSVKSGPEKKYVTMMNTL